MPEVLQQPVEQEWIPPGSHLVSEGSPPPPDDTPEWIPPGSHLAAPEPSNAPETDKALQDTAVFKERFLQNLKPPPPPIWQRVVDSAKAVAARAFPRFQLATDKQYAQGIVSPQDLQTMWAAVNTPLVPRQVNPEYWLARGIEKGTTYLPPGAYRTAMETGTGLLKGSTGLPEALSSPVNIAAATLVPEAGVVGKAVSTGLTIAYGIYAAHATPEMLRRYHNAKTASEKAGILTEGLTNMAMAGFPLAKKALGAMGIGAAAIDALMNRRLAAQRAARPDVKFPEAPPETPAAPPAPEVDQVTGVPKPQTVIYQKDSVPAPAAAAAAPAGEVPTSGETAQARIDKAQAVMRASQFDPNILWDELKAAHGDKGLTHEQVADAFEREADSLSRETPSERFARVKGVPVEEVKTQPAAKPRDVSEVMGLAEASTVAAPGPRVARGRGRTVPMYNWDVKLTEEETQTTPLKIPSTPPEPRTAHTVIDEMHRGISGRDPIEMVSDQSMDLTKIPAGEITWYHGNEPIPPTRTPIAGAKNGTLYATVSNQVAAKAIRPKAEIKGGEPDAIKPSYAQVETGETPLGEQARPPGKEPSPGDSDYVERKAQGAGRGIPQEPVPTGEPVAPTPPKPADVPAGERPEVEPLTQAAARRAAFKKIKDGRYEHKETGLIVQHNTQSGGWDIRHPTTGETLDNLPTRRTAIDAYLDGRPPAPKLPRPEPAPVQERPTRTQPQPHPMDQSRAQSTISSVFSNLYSERKISASEPGLGLTRIEMIHGGREAMRRGVDPEQVRNMEHLRPDLKYAVLRAEGENRNDHAAILDKIAQNNPTPENRAAAEAAFEDYSKWDKEVVDPQRKRAANFLAADKYELEPEGNMRSYIDIRQKFIKELKKDIKDFPGLEAKARAAARNIEKANEKSQANWDKISEELKKEAPHPEYGEISNSDDLNDVLEQVWNKHFPCK